MENHIILAQQSKALMKKFCSVKQEADDKSLHWCPTQRTVVFTRKHSASVANNHSSNVSRDLSINTGQNRSFVQESRGAHSLGRKVVSSPLSALVGPLTSIRKPPPKLKQIYHDRSESTSLPPKPKQLVSEHRKTPSGPMTPKQQTISEIIDIDRCADMLPSKYGFLIRSKNIPLQKVINYLIIVVKGLHYSLKCLKPPSLKFIQSKKIMLKDSPISSLSVTQVLEGRRLSSSI